MTSRTDTDLVPRARLQRERQARLEAEAIAEKATRELYELVRAHERVGEELRLLYAMSVLISSAQDVDTAMELTLRKVAELTGWPFAQVWVPAGTTLTCGPAVYAADVGLEAFHAASRAVSLACGVGLPGRVWESRQPLWIRDLAAETNFPRLPSAMAAGLRTGVAIPVLAGDEAVAILEFFMRTPTVEDDRLVKLVSAVASQLGSFVQRKRMDDAIRETANLATTLNSIGDGVIATDCSGVIERINPVAELLTGWPRAEALHQPLDTMLVLFDEVEQRRIDHPFVSLLTNPVSLAASRITMTARDGTQHSIAHTATPIRDATGRTTGYIVVFRDTTETRRMEARLADAQRMISMGTLAAGVAHEINNPLAYVVTNLDFLKERLTQGGNVPADANDELHCAIDEARGGLDRVREIVRGLKTFSRADDERRSIIDVRAVLESSLNIARNEIKHRARLERQFGAIPLVEANESRLGQVFLNLLINAAQAIGDGNAEHNEIRVVTATGPDGRAVIEVHDTGCGMPPAVRQRIFDPFYTTKEVGRGTGLGLSICQGIVEALGGTIHVESAIGSGSTFRVILPAAHATKPSVPVPTPPPIVETRRARILVIDDEPLIGKAICRILKHHDVVMQSAIDALTCIRAGEHVDLIICDVMMPELTGMDVHAELARSAPALLDRIIFATGGTFTSSARNFLAQPGIRYIDKPIDAKTLRDVVARLLAEHPRT